MKRRRPVGTAHPSTVVPSTPRTTVTRTPHARTERAAPPKRTEVPRPVLAPPKPGVHARRRVAHLIPDDDESTLLDVLDNLLNRGVVLNAEVILGLAGVDLVFLRLSAILCAADRVLPDAER